MSEVAKVRTTKRKKRLNSCVASSLDQSIADIEPSKIDVHVIHADELGDNKQSTFNLMPATQNMIESDLLNPSKVVIKTSIVRRKKNRSIKNKIEDVIDDRGSDLSGEENNFSP